MFCGSNYWYEGFQKVQVETYNANNNNSLIDAYTKRPENMEQLTLIDVEKYWSYDKRRWGGNGYHKVMHLLYVCFLDLTLFLIEKMRNLLNSVGPSWFCTRHFVTFEKI